MSPAREINPRLTISVQVFDGILLNWLCMTSMSVRYPSFQKWNSIFSETQKLTLLTIGKLLCIWITLSELVLFSSEILSKAFYFHWDFSNVHLKAKHTEIRLISDIRKVLYSFLMYPNWISLAEVCFLKCKYPVMDNCC